MRRPATALVRLRVPALFAGHAAGPDAVEELRVGPLGAEAAGLLPDDLPLLVRERILREAAGRPLALIELPLAYAGADDGDAARLVGAADARAGGGVRPGGADAGTAIARLVAALDDGGRPAERSWPPRPRLAGPPGSTSTRRGWTFAHPLTRAPCATRPPPSCGARATRRSRR